MHRALAVCANNLACALEEMPGRSVAERELMILAAQAARRCWAIAGTWLHVDAHGGVALERFAACEALALSARAAADDAGWSAACAQAEAACAGLAGDERAQGEARLAALRGWSR